MKTVAYPSVADLGVSGLTTDSDRLPAASTLLAIDFQGVYQVNVAATTERLTMLRFALSLLAAPFGATVALVSARIVPAASLTSWPHAPRFLFGILAIFGLLAVLPYLRMIEASITHARTARAMNNFRLLYMLQSRPEFEALGWAPNLPVDPRFPATFAHFGWPGLTATALAGLDAVCIGAGLVGLAGARPTPAVLGGAVAAAAAVLVGLCHVRIAHGGVRRPANPFGFPSVET